MNRTEFMSILEAKLQNISESERKEAIQYYEDYLNDAGIENEQEVMEELGSPDELAANIKAGLNGGAGEFTENGYSSRDGEQTQNSLQNRGSMSNGPQPVKTSGSAAKIILIIIACILLGPVVLPIGLGLVAMVFGILAGAAATLGAFFVTGIVLGFCGIIIAIFGIVKLLWLPSAGVILVGLGLLLFGLGLLLTVLMGWLFAKLIPPFIRWLVSLCRRPFEKKGGAA